MVREVRQITYHDAIPFLMEVHYARRIPSIQYAYGLYINDDLKGVVTYGQPASPTLCKGVAGEANRRNVLELNRLVICDNTPYNASYLVSKSLRMLPPHRFIVSYADIEGWGHVGYVYQATNWIYTGKTKSRTDKYSKGHSRHYTPGETRRQYRTAKYRYVYLTGNRGDKRHMKRELKYPIIDDYPKGQSMHYDTTNPIPINQRYEKTEGH